MTIGGPAETPLMGQCAITGKMVPEDELVEIQGQRVCAEGKAILMSRLAAGETAPGEFERPTVLRRFCCYFLDGLIIVVPLLILNNVVTSLSGGDHTIIGICALICTGLQILYFGAMHAKAGQTVGKMAGNIVVANFDGSRISISTAYIRAVAFCGMGIVNAVCLMIGNGTLVAIGLCITFGWGLCDVLFALFDGAMQRSLHDRIAGTRVIMKQ